MLIAKLNDISIEALRAARGLEYRCPNCKCLMVLKQGRKVIHHFAHKPLFPVSGGVGRLTPIFKQNFFFVMRYAHAAYAPKSNMSLIRCPEIVAPM